MITFGNIYINNTTVISKVNVFFDHVRIGSIRRCIHCSDRWRFFDIKISGRSREFMSLKECQDALTGPSIIHCKDCADWKKLVSPQNSAFDGWGICLSVSENDMVRTLGHEKKYTLPSHYCSDAIEKKLCQHKEIEVTRKCIACGESNVGML